MSQNNPLRALLDKQDILLLDGAMATELEARGCNLADSLWSAKVLVENPELIREVHLDYYRAGAQCAITASYQATPAGFAARGLDEAQSKALIGKSVELARKAREAYLAENPQAGTLLVAGSVGPYGAYLADGSEYRGDYHCSVEAFQAFHRPRVEALLDAGADLLACETLPNFSEIEALAELLTAYPRARAWFSFTLRDSEHLSDGTPLRDVVALLAGYPQVVALGINCIALENTTAALQHLHGLTVLPLVVLDSFFPGRCGAYVTIDNFEGARMAVRHLLSRGHRRIGHMASAVPISNFSERKQGLLAALSEYPEATLQSFPVGTTPEQAYSDMSAHLRRRPFDPALYPTAFFADNDIIAVSCIRAFREWGVRIPEDISVIGFDDVPLSCVTSPRLSTVRVEKETLGRLAITLLRDRMDNPAASAPVKLSVGTSLCLRESVRIL